MSEKHFKSKSQMKQENSRKYSRVLRRLAQSENLLTNRIKVIVTEGEIIEETDKIMIAPSKFSSNSNHSVDQNSTEKTSIKTIGNLNVNTKNTSPHHIKEVDYPDSSDFSDDE